MPTPIYQQLMLDAFDDEFRTNAGFSSAFITEAEKKHGLALGIDVWIRDNDGAGGSPSSLLLPVLSGGETVVSCNPISRRREAAFGVVSGGAWMVRLTNNTGYLDAYNLTGCHAAIIGTFPSPVSSSAVFAQGKISRVIRDSEGTISLEITDAITDILNYTIPRDMRFQSSGWLSDMKPESKASGSDSYDSAGNLISAIPAGFADETFIVEFTTPTAYKIILENGNESQTGTISTNKAVQNVNSFGVSSVLIIAAAGWGSTYSAGDRFVFYTSKPRTTTTLTPIYLIQDILDNVVGWTGYDVITGTSYPSAQYDTTNWNNLRSTYGNYSLYGVQGSWSKGSRVSTMIEDILKVVHGAIYPVYTGQIGLWVLSPSVEDLIELNGDPGSGDVSIVSGMCERDSSESVTAATYKYKSIGDGLDAEVTSIDADPQWLSERTKTVDIGWEVQGVAVESAANIYVSRFRSDLVKYDLTTTLAGALCDIGSRIRIDDASFGTAAAQADVAEVEIDLMSNAARVVSYIENVALASYATVGTSTVGGAEVIW